MHIVKFHAATLDNEKPAGLMSSAGVLLYDGYYCNALGMSFRLRFCLSSGFEVVEKAERAKGKKAQRIVLYRHSDSNRERIAERVGHRKRDKRRNAT